MRRFAIAAAAALAFPAGAFAHRGSLTYGHVRIDGDAVVYDLEIFAAELAEPLGLPRAADATQAQARAGEARLFDYVARRIAVRNGGRPCVASPGGLAFVDKADGFAASLRLRYRCARRPERVEIAYHVFFDLDARHQSFTTIEIDGTLRSHVFRQGERTLRVDRPVPAWESARDYLVLGIEHIFSGTDHICFLIGLLLVAGIDGRSGAPRGLRRGFLYTLAIVTAFTVAHSITLIASALGAIAMPSRIVESAIAASIAYVGVENVVVRAPRGRWLLTFGFGLVHGLGFAGVLREIGLPERGLVLSLVSFNVGVELGQAAIVGAIFPLLHLWSSRRSYRPVALVGGSMVIVLFAGLWFVERAFGFKLLGGALG
ncbi:MAG: HupE/UreJ family protein [Myxococcota bacterium]